MNDIAHNIQHIRARMQKACVQSGRNPDEVKLLLATKTVEPERILEAFAAGETLMGENKVQELKAKFEALKAVPHETHFIGHLQTNKVKEVVQYANCLQSLDRMELAEKLHQRLEATDKTLDVLVQVNTSFEESKFGIAPDAALAFAQSLKSLERLRIRGLMTIGLFSGDEKAVRRCFQTLRQLQQDFLSKGIAAHELSMGMSNDLEWAIAEGATIIRVGTAIFGQRIYPDSHYWNEKNPEA